LFILVLAAIAWFLAGASLWRFVVYIKDELFLALGTASTEVVLSRIVDKLMYAGYSRTTTGLVVPTGYSFNLDGVTLYLSICVLFLAQALGVDLSLGEQVTAVLVLMRCLRRWRRSDHGLDAGDGEPAGQLCGDDGGSAPGRAARRRPDAEGVARPCD
jgi:hypothetical protein